MPLDLGSYERSGKVLVEDPALSRYKVGVFESVERKIEYFQTNTHSR
jgi:hypothetical protein